MKCEKRNIILIAFLYVLMLLLPDETARTEEFNIKKIVFEENSLSVAQLTKEIKSITDILNKLPEWAGNTETRKWRRNIFYPLAVEIKPKAGIGGTKAQTGNNKTQFKLEGIFVGNNKRFALINGKAVSKGDTVNGALVVEISLNRVVLKSGKLKKELFFDK